MILKMYIINFFIDGLTTDETTSIMRNPPHFPEYQWHNGDTQANPMDIWLAALHATFHVCQ